MEFKEKLLSYRRELHAHPELSMEEIETTRRIKGWLEEEGIALCDFPYPVGVVAEIKGSLPGPTLALRGDIDALPVEEQTGLPYASRVKGKMHACGHDLHMAATLGAAILLHQNREKLHGTVRVIFQPSEENAQGAKWMVERGVLDGVEGIFGFHNRPNHPAGTIGLRTGPLLASVDRFLVEIQGIGGHGGMPQQSIDPIVTASQMVTALQAVVSRNMSPFDPVVISVTRFEGGNTWNVIPEKAMLEGTVRTLNPKARERLPELMERTVQGIGAAYGATVRFQWDPFVPSVNNDPQFHTLAQEVAGRLGYQIIEGEQITGGEDFSYFQTLIPGYFVWIYAGGDKEWHHPAYAPSDEAIPVAANYLSQLLLQAGERWEDLMKE